MKSITLFTLLLLCACTKKAAETTTSSALVIPKGTEVTGVILSGRLAGKHMYLLPANMNPSNCWVDSQGWTGSELFFGISSVNWTNLTQGSINHDPACTPSPAFEPQGAPGSTGNFNIYRAKVSGGAWVISNLPLNVGETTPLAAAKLSGSTLAFVKFEKTASLLGNIYLSTRTGDNTYNAAVPYSHNSATCSDDNPLIYADGTKMIFESTRVDAAATSCGANMTFWATTLSAGTWSVPVPVTGTPATAANSVTQAFINSNLLYYTGTSTDCAGTVMTCVKVAGASGTNDWSVSPDQIITPIDVGAGWAGGGMVGIVGQYSEGNGYAFVACGIVYDVDPTSSTAGLLFSRYEIKIRSCVIPL